MAPCFGRGPVPQHHASPAHGGLVAWGGRKRRAAHELVLNEASEGVGLVRFQGDIAVFECVPQQEQIGGRNERPAAEGMEHPALCGGAGTNGPGRRSVSSGVHHQLP